MGVLGNVAFISIPAGRLIRDFIRCPRLWSCAVWLLVSTFQFLALTLTSQNPFHSFLFLLSSSSFFLECVFVCVVYAFCTCVCVYVCVRRTAADVGVLFWLVLC